MRCSPTVSRQVARASTEDNSNEWRTGLSQAPWAASRATSKALSTPVAQPSILQEPSQVEACLVLACRTSRRSFSLALKRHRFRRLAPTVKARQGRSASSNRHQLSRPPRQSSVRRKHLHLDSQPSGCSRKAHLHFSRTCKAHQVASALWRSGNRLSNQTRLRPSRCSHRRASAASALSSSSSQCSDRRNSRRLLPSLVAPNSSSRAPCSR